MTLVTLRMAITRALFRVVEAVAIQKRGPRRFHSGPGHPSDHIPGDYSKDEFDALRAIWRRSVVRDFKD